MHALQVVDEIHMLGDGHRGSLLELMLAKLRARAPNLQVRAEGPVHDSRTPICLEQLICMSATLPNLGDLATWLDAQLYATAFRPVPLAEHVKIGTKVRP